MPAHTVKFHKVKIGANDVSANVKDCTLTIGSEIQDSTAMGATARGRISGLKTWEAEVVLLQDAADSTLNDLLGATMAAGVAVTCKFCPGEGNSTTGTTTNPIYHGSGLITEMTPISGEVGQLAMVTVKIKAAGDLTRDTDNSPTWAA